MATRAMLDKQKIQDSFEKNILEKNFKELFEKIKSNDFMSEYDDITKQKVTKQMQEIFQNKIDSISKIPELSYNFSATDMEKVIDLIDEVNQKTEERVEELARSHNILINSLELNEVSLVSAPKDDEIGPVFSELTKTSREMGELVNELEHIEALISQEKSIIIRLVSREDRLL